jgi:sugar lactone lactonase YvrE
MNSNSLIASLLCVVLAACGGGGGSNDNSTAPPPPPPPPVITKASISVLAGADGGSGSTDGTGAAARFNQPNGLATDAQGNVYVSDYLNCTVRKITPAGVVSTYAGVAGSCQHTDGIKATARLILPFGVAVDSAGDVYVAEEQDIRKIAPDGSISTLAGVAPPSGVANGGLGNADGTGASAHFYEITAITIDGSGNLYVLDSACDPLFGCGGTSLPGGSVNIRKITQAGVVTTLTTVTSAVGLAADAAGDLFYRDRNGNIAERTAAGATAIVAAAPGPNGPPFVEGLTVTPNGSVYVTVSSNIVGVVAPNGTITTIAGTIGTIGTSGDADGTGAAARFSGPTAIASDTSGNLFVIDGFTVEGGYIGETIRKIAPGGVVTTLAGDAGITGAADGTGTAALFNDARGITADAAGNLYVADHGNGTIRKVTPAGAVTTLAGTPGVLASAELNGIAPVDGAGSIATFCGPEGVAVDSSGNVFVADACNDVRKVTAAGVVTTIENNTTLGGGNAPGIYFDPPGIAIDTAGNLYLTDVQYLAGFGTGIMGAVVDKVAAGPPPFPPVTTLAGTPTATGAADGTGAAAMFYDPIGIAVDTQGNSYVADKLNCNIRKITPAGVVTTIAGSAGHCTAADGTGTAATFKAPTGLAIDGSGNLYVVDGGSTIRKIAPGGVVTTVAGDATQTGFASDSQPGTYFTGYGIAVIDAHTLAVSTYFNIIKIILP